MYDTGMLFQANLLSWPDRYMRYLVYLPSTSHLHKVCDK